MTSPRLSPWCILFLSCILLPAGLLRGQQVAAISADPAPDPAHPAAMLAVQVPSHGSLLNGLVYVASGAGPHPAVVLLHGFPGNEKNLDLAQAIRRAGWDVLYFDYRGAWGSPGTFSFAHSLEDTAAALQFLRTPAQAATFRLDPRRIVLIGHSMGGFLAADTTAADPGVIGLAMISAADMSLLPQQLAPKDHPEQSVSITAKRLGILGIAPLAGCTSQSLAEELLAHQDAWDFTRKAAALANRPILVVTSNDGQAPASDALVHQLKKMGGAPVTAVHLETDHVYSGQRITLETTVLSWLETLGLR